jgi:hypothetical protein
MSSNLDRVRTIITTGSEMAGAASGGVLGFLMGGPGGAAMGGVAGVAISKVSVKVLSDVAYRSLSQREEIRIGAAATFAIQNIQRRLENGEHPRNDEFFQAQQHTSRTNAEEIFEGVLLKSKNEHEEKKVKIFGNIFANIAFTPDLRIGEANHILQIAENLTYRQMCLLSLFCRKDEIHDLELPESLNNTQSFEIISIQQEIYQLYNFGLLGCRIPDSSNSSDFSDGWIASDSSNYQALLGWDDVKPNLMELSYLAQRYYVIMGLNEVSSIDLEDVATHLVIK